MILKRIAAYALLALVTVPFCFWLATHENASVLIALAVVALGALLLLGRIAIAIWHALTGRGYLPARLRSPRP